jgi:hypothetical protein
MICALLIFQQPRPPAPIAQLSPWLDHLIAPREQVFAQLAGQEHRRFIKTHTPLDGIPLDPRVTYLVTARHPLDVAVSLYHHSANIDRARFRQLIGQPEPTTPPPPLPPLHEGGGRRPVPGFLQQLSSGRSDSSGILEALLPVPAEEWEQLTGITGLADSIRGLRPGQSAVSLPAEQPAFRGFRSDGHARHC